LDRHHRATLCAADTYHPRHQPLRLNTTEMERGFADLVNWVSNGVKPAGDDILTPAVVANPNFGCNFTVGAHALAPACP
jgi:hypothetical protein